MANIKHHKFVASLPTVLEADSIYFVRVGTGFDIYVTNSSGTIVAYPINREPPIAAGTSAQYWNGLKAWVDFGASVRAALLTGLSTATSSAIVAGDTFLVGMGKLQAQINSANTSIGGKEPTIAGGTVAQVWRGDKTWIDLGPAVRATSLAGLSITNSAIVATDSLLIAGGKTQGQINAINTTLSGKANAGSNSDITDLNTLSAVTFSGLAGRIRGDMTHATQSNRLALQTTTSNGATIPSILPNGTSTVSGIQCYNSSDANNAGLAQIAVTTTAMQVLSGIQGTGTYLPIDFYAGGASRMRVQSAGGLSVGHTSVNPVIDQVGGVFLGGAANIMNNNVNGTTLAIGKSAGTAGGFITFYYNGVNVGSITTTGTVTAYNTSSDYRLKDKIENADAEAAWLRLDGYRIRSFVYKAQPDKVVEYSGVAHELAETNPDMVTGDKDAVELLGSLYGLRPVGDLYSADGELVSSGIEEPFDHPGWWNPTGFVEVLQLVEVPLPLDPLPGTRWEQTGERMIIQGVDWSKAVPELILNLQTAKAMILELQRELAEVRQAISA
ncbi:hypothetical protein [Pseudomonas denitrificans (nom. rej.)]|uniref:Peptidase S74 domain-containing protein n=1 Tax=Pseudomonas denitrificans TaxID=43306 RepID=A0A9X7N222_PSEDE|nr:hypothetical protein [Pseudomonas denitrificans (nom. rej.)]QEY73211.1 hypothetical protein F1C79_17240 [Pseudomonas denitrificans (nom. rej.)]